MSNVTDFISDKLAKAFPRQVVKMPLFGPENIPSPHYGICFDDATEKADWCQCTVKKNYRPHTNEDVRDLVSIVADGFDIPSSDIEVKASWVTGKGHAVAVTPTKKHRRSIAGNDTIWPSLVVRAYYGGAFKATVSMKRDACSNLQMIRNVSQSTVNLRHTFSFHDHFADTLELFQNLIAKSDDVVQAARQLNEIRVNYSTWFDYLYPEQESPTSKRSVTTRQRKIDRMKEIHQRECSLLDTKCDNRSGTLWELVNSVTGFVQHDKTRFGKPSEDDRALLAVFDNESNRAWDAAFDMMNGGLAV